MSTAADDELRVLRARAYGRGADIEKDPAALRRLQELESQRQAGESDGEAVTIAPDVVRTDDAVESAEPVVDPALAVFAPPPPSFPPSETAVPVSHDPAGLDTPASPDTPAVADAPAVTAAPASRRTWILWAASVAAAAALAAAGTHALVMVTPVAASAGAPQIATLEPTSTVEVPSGWMGVGPSSLVFEYYGLALVEAAGGYYSPGAGGADCLTVLRTDQVPDKTEFDAASGWSYEGPIYSGCAVGVFPTTVEVPIDSSSPKELSAKFPSGRALQFVYDGERVGVFLDSE